MKHLAAVRLWSATAIGAAGTLTSGAIRCLDGDADILSFKCVSAAGAADVKIEWAGSDDGVTFNSFTSSDPLAASTNTTYTGKNPEDTHFLIPPVAPWIQIKVTELTGALTDTLVTAILWLNEDISS